MRDGWTAQTERREKKKVLKAVHIYLPSVSSELRVQTELSSSSCLCVVVCEGERGGVSSSAPPPDLDLGNTHWLVSADL